MGTVSTTYGTYSTDLFIPEVVQDLIEEKLISNIVFAPMAMVDNSLQGNAGDTVTLPYFGYIGDAETVAEGTDIPIAKLAQYTKEVKISKIGKGVILTDEAMLSGYGDPYGEAAKQITLAIASKVDNMLYGALNTNTAHVYTAGSGGLSASDIPLAMSLYGEDYGGDKVLVCDADFYAKLLNVSSWIPASQLAAETVISGVVGMIYGCQVIVSDRVRGSNFHILKRDTLAIFSKRGTMVEADRDIINQSNIITGSKLFAPYLLNPAKAIKIVSGIDAGLAPVTVTSEAGTASGDTKITVAGYTLGTGESWKYTVADALPNVVLSQDLSSYTAWNGSADITAATGKTIVIAAADSNGKAVAAGSATVTAHA